MTPARSDDKVKAPWWLHVLLAILSYLLLKYGPALLLSPARQESLAFLTDLAAPITAIIFLLLAANALYRHDPSPDETGKDDADQ